MPMYQLPGYETEEDRVAPPVVAPPALPPAAASPYKLPSSFVAQAGTPGVGVVGPTAYRVGVQKWGPADWQAWSERQAALEGQQRAAVTAREEEALQRRYLEGLRVQDSLKAIQAERQFLAQRMVGQEVDAAIKQGIPLGQATVAALFHHPEAAHALPTGLLSGLARGSQIPAATDLGKTFPVYNDQGEYRGDRLTIGANRVQYIPKRIEKPAVSSATKLSSISTQIRWRQERLRNSQLAELRDPAIKARNDQYRAEIQDLDKKLASLGSGEEVKDALPLDAEDLTPIVPESPAPGAEVAPSAVPAGAPTDFTWDKVNKLRRSRNASNRPS